ncbi:hypothetical protein AKJ16_DCAP01720 [Drosera capensis]
MAYAKMIVPYPKKLDDRSQPMVYLGVEEGRDKSIYQRLCIPLQVLDFPDSGPVRLRDIADIYSNTKEVALDDDQDELMSQPATEKQQLRAPGHRPIGLKWVFKLKKDSDRQVVEHKASELELKGAPHGCQISIPQRRVIGEGLRYSAGRTKALRNLDSRDALKSWPSTFEVKEIQP